MDHFNLCTRCQVWLPIQMFIDSSMCELCANEQLYEDIEVQGITYTGPKKKEFNETKPKYRTCKYCKEKKPINTYVGLRCGNCDKIRTKRCGSCKLYKIARLFIDARRCRDCVQASDFDFPELNLRCCNACNKIKPIDDFPLRGGHTQGRRRKCFDCKRQQDRQYNKDNLDARLINISNWITREKLLPIRLSQHGTQMGYMHKKCRCTACVSYYKRVMMPSMKAAGNRRRHKATVTLTPEDIELSVAYRKAIAHDECFFCGVAPGEEDEHWLAIINGGTDHWYNLTRSCVACNRGAGGKHSKLAEEFYIERVEAGLPINPRFALRVLAGR